MGKQMLVSTDLVNVNAQLFDSQLDKTSDKVQLKTENWPIIFVQSKNYAAKKLAEYPNIKCVMAGQYGSLLEMCAHEYVRVFGPCQYLCVKPFRFVKTIRLLGTAKVVQKSEIDTYLQ